MNRKEQIEACARAAHEFNRAYCIAIGDRSQPPWENAPRWQRTSVRDGVQGVLDGNDPEESHERWRAAKKRTGWKYGPVKDPVQKTHPCFMPYRDLPEEQRRKDEGFVTCVRTMAELVALL